MSEQATKTETHTSGPWTLGYGMGLSGPTTPSAAGPCCDEECEYVPVSKGTLTIAIVPQQRDGTLKANARLISKAPELLEGLQQAIEQLEADYVATPLDGRAALISKLKAIAESAAL